MFSYRIHDTSGVARNINNFGGHRLTFLSLPFSLLSLSFPPLHFLPYIPSRASPFPLPSLPLEVGPTKIQVGSMRERSELPHWCLGQSPSRNRIWCICALKDEIWWQQF